MSERPIDREFLNRAAHRVGLIVVGISALALCGCNSKPGKSKLDKSASKPVGGNPAHTPRYAFAPEVADADPEVAAFVRSFLETCLTGDYEGYRRLCSLRQDPESRDRFQRVYQAISKLTVREIAEVEAATMPRPTYRVINEVEFVEGKTPVFGEDRRAIAILVFREEGQWRVLPAPTKLQPPRPNRTPDSQSTSGPSTTQPVEYPWDQSGDD